MRGLMLRVLMCDDWCERIDVQRIDVRGLILTRI